LIAFFSLVTLLILLLESSNKPIKRILGGINIKFVKIATPTLKKRSIIKEILFYIKKNKQFEV